MTRKNNSSVRLNTSARAKNIVSMNEVVPQTLQQQNLLFGVH